MPDNIGAMAGAFAASWVLTLFFAKSRVGGLALDRPNARSLHAHPIPRTGGLAVVLATLAAWLWISMDANGVWIAALIVLCIISFVDDLRGLPVLARLAVHLACAGFAVVTIAGGTSMWIQVIAVIAVAWMINLFNFMDGSDGLAGGMACCGFGFYGIAAWLTGDSTFASMNGVVAAAAAGFLLWNFHPARIFLGDAGSVPLGFLAGAFGYQGWVSGDWPWWFPICVFSPFIVDASVTLARRLYRRERVWQAHREHYYQRLVQIGWGHAGTAWAEYALMLGCGGAALATLRQTWVVQAAILAALAIVYAGLALAIDNAWRVNQTGHAS